MPQRAVFFALCLLFAVDLQALNVSLRRGNWDSRYTDIEFRVQPGRGDGTSKTTTKANIQNRSSSPRGPRPLLRRSRASLRIF